MNTKNFLKNYWKTIIWSIIMCYLLFSPGSGLPKANLLNFSNSDKLMHASMFAILTFTYLLDSEGLKKWKFRVVLFSSGIICFGALSEIVQHHFISGRTGNIYDTVADVVGLIIGFVGFTIYKKLLYLINLAGK